MTVVVLLWALVLARVVSRKLRPVWALGPQDPPAAPDVPVTLVIPARNEVNNLGPALDCALAQDHPNLQIVVLDDGSTDGTGEVLARYAQANPGRITPLSGGEALPPGWFGKPWALQRAQRHATGRWLVFLDADVRLAPQCVSRVVGHGERQGLDMVTGLGELVMESFWERVLQPAMGGVILLGNNLDEVNDPARKDKNLANGQLIAIRRGSYDRLGGHEVVRDNILDDVGLARALKARDMRYHCLTMRSLFRVRMYTSLGEIWEGWTKNLFAGMHYSVKNVLISVSFLAVFVLTGPALVLLAAAGVVGREWLAWGLVHWALVQGVRAVYDAGTRQRLYGLTHVPATALTLLIMLNSARRSRRGGVRWRGRVYDVSRAPAGEGAASGADQGRVS